MKAIYVVQTTMSIEFSNGEFTTWDERPVALYAYTKQEDAKNSIQEKRQSELAKYKEWLTRKKKNCFIHHNYSIQELMLFENQNDF